MGTTPVRWFFCLFSDVAWLTQTYKSQISLVFLEFVEGPAGLNSSSSCSLKDASSLTARSIASSRPSLPSTLCVSSCTLLHAATARRACAWMLIINSCKRYKCLHAGCVPTKCRKYQTFESTYLLLTLHTDKTCQSMALSINHRRMRWSFLACPGVDERGQEHNVDGSSPYLGCTTSDFLQRSSTELPQAGSLLEAHLEFCSNDGCSAAALSPRQEG